jgi:hypothetical protein
MDSNTERRLQDNGNFCRHSKGYGSSWATSYAIVVDASATTTTPKTTSNLSLSDIINSMATYLALGVIAIIIAIVGALILRKY